MATVLSVNQRPHAVIDDSSHASPLSWRQYGWSCFWATFHGRSGVRLHSVSASINTRPARLYPQSSRSAPVRTGRAGPSPSDEPAQRALLLQRAGLAMQRPVRRWTARYRGRGWAASRPGKAQPACSVLGHVPHEAQSGRLSATCVASRATSAHGVRVPSQDTASVL